MKRSETYMTTQEAGRALGVSASTIRNLVRRRVLAAFRPTGAAGWRRIRQSDVEAYKRRMGGN